MLFVEIDFARFIQLYVIQGIITVFFLYLSYKIIKRDSKRLNIIFASLYIAESIGLIINMIYAVIDNEFTVLILNFMTNFSTAFGPIFLVVFNYILLKSEMSFNITKQLLIIFSYGICLFLVILFLPIGGITINASTNWKPVWSLPTYIYVISIITIFIVIPLLITSVRVYQQFDSVELKKRWKYFIVGAFGLLIYMIGAFTSNMLNIPLVRTFYSILGLSIVIFVSLMYYGVGKSLEKR